jgi:hypothetical protein
MVYYDSQNSQNLSVSMARSCWRWAAAPLPSLPADTRRLVNRNITSFWPNRKRFAPLKMLGSISRERTIDQRRAVVEQHQRQQQGSRRQAPSISPKLFFVEPVAVKFPLEYYLISSKMWCKALDKLDVLLDRLETIKEGSIMCFSHRFDGTVRTPRSDIRLLNPCYKFVSLLKWTILVFFDDPV